MIFFYDDYSDGAHPNILKKLVENNDKPQLGYGEDEYSEAATKLIVSQLGADADVYFLSGGTQVNITALSHSLRHFEAVVAADCAHINTHEAGGLEASGHKIIPVPTKAGKMDPAIVDRIVAEHDEYMVVPKILEITQATEQGTVYTFTEIKELVAVAKKHNLIVYVDGARLAHALASQSADFELTDLPKLGIDMFYIGGTKNGTLCGEALIVINKDLRTSLNHSVRQRGGTLAKGRLLSLQFLALFQDDLWRKTAKHANDMAQVLAAGIINAKLELAYPTEINQVFILLTPEQVTKLKEKYGFHITEKPSDDKWIGRFVCSWATTDTQVKELIADLNKL